MDDQFEGNPKSTLHRVDCAKPINENVPNPSMKMRQSHQ